MVCQFVSWSFGLLVFWLVVWLEGLLVGRMVSWLVVWFTRFMAGRLVGRSIGLS